MSDAFPSLVSTRWLAEHVGDERLVILDASKHLPGAKRDPEAEFKAGHISGARFLALDTLIDAASSVPAALPSADQVAERLSHLGVATGDRIVLYDDSAIKSSARAWFALTSFAIAEVAVLDGGIGKWRAEGRALDDCIPTTKPASLMTRNSLRRTRTKAEMIANLTSKAEQVLDARAADRVFGSGTDPVHGGQNGRIPGSFNLPYSALFAENGTYLPKEQMKALFESAGIDLTRPTITTCGSGMTASVLLFAMHLCGKNDVLLYDGSWMEWAADPETPKMQGPLERGLG